MKKIYMLLNIILFIFSSAVLAQNTSYSTSFNPLSENKKLDRIDTKLNKYSLNINQVRQAADEVKSIRRQSSDCVSNSNDRLSIFSEQLKKIKETNLIVEKTKDQEYFTGIVKKLINQRADCRLLYIRADEMAKSLNQEISTLESKKRLQMTSNFWELASNVTFKKIYNSFNYKLLSTYFNLDFFVKYLYWIIASFIVITILFYRLTRNIRKYDINLPDKIIKIMLSYKKSIILTLSQLTVMTGLLLISVSNFYMFLLSVSLSLIVAVIIGFDLLYHYVLLKINEKYEGEISISNIKNALKILIIYLLSIGILYFVFHSQVGLKEFFMFLETIFTCLLVINAAVVLIMSAKIYYLTSGNKNIYLAIKFPLLFVCAIIIIAKLMGYHYFTDYLIYSVSQSLLLLGITVWLHNKTQRVFDSINLYSKGGSWQYKLKHILGLKKNVRVPELIWARFTAIIILWIFFCIFFLEIWEMPISYQVKLYSMFFDGIRFGGFHFIPVKVCTAVYVYAFLAMATRSLRAKIGRQTSKGLERGAQNSFAAIVGYIGFAISILIAMVVAGINLAGIALVAGALSVGIGFGLQGIVNNFVSGLVLLLERPIKVGDRIEIQNQDIDGHVLKINSRSTVIKTRHRTEVIVPNADLVNGVVNNLMYSNSYQRLSLIVGVAYGSDIDLVHDTLLEIAAAHEDVLDEEGNMPLALFNNFGNSSLEFELRLVIKNVDRRQVVRSELNFAIDKAFRRLNIEIAFPQMDLHIKKDPNL